MSPPEVYAQQLLYISVVCYIGFYDAVLYASKHLTNPIPRYAHAHALPPPFSTTTTIKITRNGTSFSERFPLSPELWQEWIDDRRAAGGEDGVEDVLALFRRAFSDYQCAKLWPGYLEALEESLDVSAPSQNVYRFISLSVVSVVLVCLSRSCLF